MTPSQMLARIEALGSVDAKYIAKIRQQIEDPSKDVKSQAIVKFLFNNRLITKAEAKKLLTPPAEVAKPAANFQIPPPQPVAEVPFNDDPNHMPEGNFNPMLILAFLNFHRRFIIGAMLLAGVAYLLIRLNDSSPADEVNESVTRVNDPAPPSGTTEPTPYTAEINDQGASEPVTLTIDDQINWLLTSAGRWRNASVEDAAVILNVRHGEIEKLISDPRLKSNQQTYCIQEYIKAVGSMSEINQKISVGVEGIDEKIAKVVQAYEENENEDIAALAKAALVGHLAWQFTGTQNDEDLEAFIVAFLEKREAIAISDLATRHITKAIRDVAAKAADDPRVREITTEHLSSVLYLSDDAVVDLAKNLYFPAVDWKSMASRLRTRSPGADSDIQLLLTSVREHPETPLTVYSTIATAIKWYQEINEDEKAQQCLDQLEEVGATITSKRIHDEVQKGIQILKESAKKKGVSEEEAGATISSEQIYDEVQKGYKILDENAKKKNESEE